MAEAVYNVLLWRNDACLKWAKRQGQGPEAKAYLMRHARLIVAELGDEGARAWIEEWGSDQP